MHLFSFGVSLAAGGLVGGGLVGGGSVAAGAEVDVGGAVLAPTVGVGPPPVAAAVGGGFVGVAVRDPLPCVPWTNPGACGVLVGNPEPVGVGVAESEPSVSRLPSRGIAPGVPACMAVSV